MKYFNEERLDIINKIFEENEEILYQNKNYMKYNKRLSEIIINEEILSYSKSIGLSNDISEIQQLYYFIRRYENSLMYNLGLEEGKKNKINDE